MKVQRKSLALLILVLAIVGFAFLKNFILGKVPTEIGFAIYGYSHFFVLAISISGLLYIHWKKKFEKIGVILAGTYFLLLLYAAIEVALVVNMGQAEWYYETPMFFIQPFRPIIFYIAGSIEVFVERFVNYSTPFGDHVYLVVHFFLSFLIAFLLIGCTSYYLIGKNIELTIRNFKTAKVLSIINIVTFAFLIYMLIIAAQWSRIAKWNGSCYASMKAKYDFNEGKLRLYELTDGETSYFTGRKNGNLEIWTKPRASSLGDIPYRIDERNFVYRYNIRMEVLNEKNKKSAK